MKAWRNDQSRMGLARRRRLEYNAIRDQITRRKGEFTARLQRRLVERGACLCYVGTIDHKGYARFNVRYRGQHVTIHAHRAFLILKLGRPIRRGFEAGHLPECQHRTCVKHLREEHYTSNAATALKRAA